MTCGYGEGISIDFLRSGLAVTPYEVTTRSGETEFSHTKLKVARRAGEVIASEALEFEPVLVKFNGTTQDRYMFHPEAVSLHNEDATITLYDAEKVLEEGSITKHFQNTTVRDVFEYIIDRRDDPNGVINGIWHPSNSIEDFNVEDTGRLGQTGWVGAAAGMFTGLVEAAGHPEHDDTSLKLKKDTPFDAIKKASSQFALDTWVDKHGYFHYGLKGADAGALEIGPNNPGRRLKEYNVTVGSGKVSQIIYRGRYTYRTLAPASGPSRQKEDLRSWGKAWLVDDDGNRIPGRTIEPEDPIGAVNPKGVEDAARRALVQHYMGRKNGNIVINAGSSQDKSSLTKLAVGDFIAASAEIEEQCKRKIDSGIFVVNSVQHKLDRRRGWLVDVGVAAVPASDIASESWLEDPESNETWDDLNDFRSDGNIQ